MIFQKFTFSSIFRVSQSLEEEETVNLGEENEHMF